FSTGTGPYLLYNAGGALPGGTDDKTPFYVEVVNATTVRLHQGGPSGPVQVFATAGTGTSILEEAVLPFVTLGSTVPVASALVVVAHNATSTFTTTNPHWLEDNTGPFILSSTGTIPTGIDPVDSTTKKSSPVPFYVEVV